MKDIYDFLKTFDMHTIIVVGIAFWWMNGNIKELDQRLNQQIASLDQRLNEKISFLDGRINGLSERVARIEGILTPKNLCAVQKTSKEGE